jgi:hypothetical protein
MLGSQGTLVHAASVVEFAIWLVCGFFLLAGKGWARYPFFMLPFAHNGYLAFTSENEPLRLVSILPPLIVVAYFLFRTEARKFFAYRGVDLETSIWPSMRTAASVVFYSLAGFLFFTNGFVVGFWNSNSPSKLVMFTVFLIAALMALVIGMALSEDRRWLRDIGVILISVATIYAFYLLAELTEPALLDSIALAEPAENDLVSAGVWTLTVGLIGALLLWASTYSRHADVQEPLT